MTDQPPIVQTGDLVIRRMRDEESEYRQFVEWRNRPHVRNFWEPDLPPMTLELAIEEERPDTQPGSFTTACFIELDGKPVGFIQFFRWIDYAREAEELQVPFDADSWSLDVFIGEPDLIGKGVGTRVVRLLSDHLLNERGASSVSFLTEVRNKGAIRAYEKAGFHKVKQVLDTDTYQGERVMSWLMTKDAPTQEEKGSRSGSTS